MEGLTTSDTLLRQYHDERLQGARAYIRQGFTPEAAVRAARADIEQRAFVPPPAVLA